MTPPSIPERFEVLAQVASTDAEVLLRARDKVLEREVFLKYPGPGLAAAYRDRDLAETVLREARAVARVRHPGVIGLIDVLETADGPLLVLEPITGEPLAERLAREGRLEPAEVLELGIALAGALEAVHAAGVVHRGISTKCVVLGEGGRAALTGFHFAKPHAGNRLVSMASLDYESRSRCSVLPEHPAPEQFQGKKADSRCDLFSLAWVLFESLTGEVPFEGDNPCEWKTPKDAGKLVTAPRNLVRAITSCLAPEASRRLDGAAALRRALEACRETTATAAESPTPQKSKHGTLGWTAAVTFIVVAGSVYFLRDPFGASAAAASTGARGMEVVKADGGTRLELSDRYETSYALLIGIGNAYEGSGFPVLPNAERDVEGIVEALSTQTTSDWQIETLLGKDASGDAVIDALAALSDRTEPNDRVFVYFAGHGIAHEVSDDSGWMIPADAVRDKRSSWVRFDELFRFFGESEAKHILVAMDCCYGGRLTTARSAGASAFSKRFLTRKAHVVVASGRGDEAVSDGTPGGHSPFAAAFLAAIDGDEPLTTTMLFAQIQRTFTERDTGHTPQFGYPDGSPAGGEFVFFLKD